MQFAKGSKILFIGAHPDDIELNCLGSILKWSRECSIRIFILISTAGQLKSNSFSDRTAEQIEIARKYGAEECKVLGYKDGSLKHTSQLVSSIEQIVNKIDPDYVFTHYHKDYHQDHVAVSLSTISALRGRRIGLFFYESITNNQHPLEEFTPHVYVDITEYIEEKVKLLKEYKSQVNSYYFSENFIKESTNLIDSHNNSKFFEKFRLGYIFE